MRSCLLVGVLVIGCVNIQCTNTQRTPADDESKHSDKQDNEDEPKSNLRHNQAKAQGSQYDPLRQTFVNADGHIPPRRQNARPNVQYDYLNDYRDQYGQYGGRRRRPVGQFRARDDLDQVYHRYNRPPHDEPHVDIPRFEQDQMQIRRESILNHKHRQLFVRDKEPPDFDETDREPLVDIQGRPFERHGGQVGYNARQEILARDRENIPLRENYDQFERATERFGKYRPLDMGENLQFGERNVHTRNMKNMQQFNIRDRHNFQRERPRFYDEYPANVEPRIQRRRYPMDYYDNRDPNRPLNDYNYGRQARIPLRQRYYNGRPMYWDEDYVQPRHNVRQRNQNMVRQNTQNRADFELKKKQQQDQNLEYQRRIMENYMKDQQEELRNRNEDVHSKTKVDSRTTFDRAEIELKKKQQQDQNLEYQRRIMENYIKDQQEELQNRNQDELQRNQNIHSKTTFDRAEIQLKKRQQQEKNREYANRIMENYMKDNQEELEKRKLTKPLKTDTLEVNELTQNKQHQSQDEVKTHHSKATEKSKLEEKIEKEYQAEFERAFGKHPMKKMIKEMKAASVALQKIEEKEKFSKRATKTAKWFWNSDEEDCTEAEETTLHWYDEYIEEKFKQVPPKFDMQQHFMYRHLQSPVVVSSWTQRLPADFTLPNITRAGTVIHESYEEQTRPTPVITEQDHEKQTKRTPAVLTLGYHLKPSPKKQRYELNRSDLQETIEEEEPTENLKNDDTFYKDPLHALMDEIETAPLNDKNDAERVKQNICATRVFNFKNLSIDFGSHLHDLKITDQVQYTNENSYSDSNQIMYDDKCTSQPNSDSQLDKLLERQEMMNMGMKSSSNIVDEHDKDYGERVGSEVSSYEKTDEKPEEKKKKKQKESSPFYTSSQFEEHRRNRHKRSVEKTNPNTAGEIQTELSRSIVKSPNVADNR
ncbi:hypothetical protein WDU94_015328 [Cyamophila willieti]